eukprot:10465345-Heterocapsa_arctica.AAC.1
MSLSSPSPGGCCTRGALSSTSPSPGGCCTRGALSSAGCVGLPSTPLSSRSGCSLSTGCGRRPFHQVFSGRTSSPSSESSHVRGGQPATTTTR